MRVVIVGAKEAEATFDNLIKNVNPEKVRQVLVKHGQKITKHARTMVVKKTGKGAEGITYNAGKFNVKIGWAERPRFHLYFHEHGAHIVNNWPSVRQSYIWRDKRGTRKRHFKKGTPYLKARPHIAPSAVADEPSFFKDMDDLIEIK